MSLRSENQHNVRPGYPPSREDMFWVDAMRQVLFDSALGMRRAAAIICWLAGLGLLGYAGWLLSPWSVGRASGYFEHVLLLLPVACWAGAVFFGVLVFLVRRYRYFANSPDSSRLAFRRISRRRARYLYRALVLWIAGVVAALLVAVIVA